MDFSLPIKEVFVSSRTYSYSYIYIAAEANKPTLLLVHGWPSHADDWIHQIRYFASKGWGLIVPDMLGYGESSAPTDVEAYRLRLISQDLAELLDNKQVDSVAAVGHDWGSIIVSRFAIYHPERLTAVALLGIGASRPGTPFDIDALDEMSRSATGVELAGYIRYISRDPVSQRNMEQNAGSVMDVMFAADQTSWYRYLHARDGFKTFVEEGRHQRVAEWFPQELRRSHLRTFGRVDGYLGASRYYRMLDQNLALPDEADYMDFTIEHPVLLVVPRVPAASSQAQLDMILAWASNVTVCKVDSGHWVHIEQDTVTNRAIESLLSGAVASDQDIDPKMIRADLANDHAQ